MPDRNSTGAQGADSSRKLTTMATRTSALSHHDAIPIGKAVQAFHTIRRLGIMLTMEIPADASEETHALALSIRDIAENHGARLDTCLGKLNPGASLGVFEDDAAEVART